MPNLCKQRQRDDGSDGPERRPCGLAEPPERITKDGARNGAGFLRLVSRAGREDNWAARSVQDGVRIAFGKQLEGAFADFGTDEYEFGMDVPRRYIGVRIPHRSHFGREDSRPRHDPKPMLEPNGGVKSDGTQRGNCYRPAASLT